MAKHDIPASAAYTSRFYQGGEMGSANDAVSISILEEGSHPLLSPYYQSCLAASEAPGQSLAPLEPVLELIAKADPADLDSVMIAVAGMHAASVSVLFSQPRPADDLSTGKMNLLQLFEGGLALPRPTYYTDPMYEQLRASYVDHVTRMLQLLGIGSSSGEAVVELETELARISVPQQGDFLKAKSAYNPMLVDALEQRSSLRWATYLEKIGFNTSLQLNLANPTFFEKLPTVLGKTDAQTLQAYFRFQLVHTLSTALPPQFNVETFKFFGQLLQGQKVLPTRPMQCLADVNSGALGFALGKVWIERQFPAAAEEAAVAMFETIRHQFVANLATGVSWLDNSTRAYAETKAGEVVGEIGYPSQWPSFTGLPDLDSGSHLRNKLAVASFAFQGLIARSDKPVQAHEWDLVCGVDGVNPQTVTAFNAESPNQMIVPAGIIQAPLFVPGSPTAMLYGGLATIVGHEFTHSFDNIGRHFGTSGQLLDWWSSSTDEAFESRAQCFIEQYGSYDADPAVPGLKLNGSFTLQENIADNGGLRLAWGSYRDSIGPSEGGEMSAVEGLSNDQLFFVQFAQNWCFKMTPDYAKLWQQNNQHSTPRNRAKGCIANMPEFAAAFRCEAGTSHNPVKRCEIW